MKNKVVRCEINDHIAGDNPEAVAALFAEELGAVLQISPAHKDEILARYAEAGLSQCVYSLGQPDGDDVIRLRLGGGILLETPRRELQRIWAATRSSPCAIIRIVPVRNSRPSRTIIIRA